MADREQPAVFGRDGLYLRQRAAGLDRDRVVRYVDVALAVQTGERDDDLAAAGIGNGAAAETGIATLRHHGDARFPAGSHHGGDLLGGLRPGHGRRPALVQADEVATKANQVLRFAQQSARPQRGVDPLQGHAEIRFRFAVHGRIRGAPTADGKRAKFRRQREPWKETQRDDLD